MLEKITEKKALIREELLEAKLNNPFSRRFEVLIYLKQKKDFSLATTDVDIEKNCNFNLHTTRSFLRTLVQINMVKKTTKRNSVKNYFLTEKGERFLYDAILPVFAKQQKIAKKIFFRENLLRGEKVSLEKQKSLEDAFTNLIENSLPWFKKWLKKEFGESMAFEDWFQVFEREHGIFLKQQLENEKKKIVLVDKE